MKNRKLGRVVVAGAVGLVVLGAVVVAGGAAGNDSVATLAPQTMDDAIGESTGSDGVMTSIEQALGRPSSGATAPMPPVDTAKPIAPSYSTGDKDMAVRSAAADTHNTMPGGASVATGASGGGAPNLAATDDRKIVQTATMRLQVDEVGASFEEV